METAFNDTVRSLRHQLGMTQEEFAHALGLTVGTINRWENGRFHPSKLARATILDFAHRRGISFAAGDNSVQADRVDHHVDHHQDVA
jgi:DNA-binding transcriptional regulator YiaG